MTPHLMEPNHRILVVDDNQAIHDDLRKILSPPAADVSELESDEALLFGAEPVQLVNFEIDSAYQGQEGLNAVERSIAQGRPYAVAFVDVRMPPGWDGVETIDKLWEADPALQVVICTAYSDYSWRDIRRRLGHSDNLLILKKPFDNIEVIQLAYALTRKWLVSRQAAARMQDLDRMVAQRTAELQSAEEAFHIIFEASPISIALLDMEGRHLDVNPAYESLFGLNRDQIIGQDMLELGWVRSRETLDDLARALASFGGVDARELVLTTSRMGPRTCLLWLREVTIHHQPHALVFCLDITDRKKMEEDLHSARTSAEASERAKSQFLANMSHEIRTPLNGVLGLSALLEEQDVPEETRSALRLIRTSGETLAKILDDVLDFSKIESGKLDLEQAPFSLRECLEWSVDLFRARASAKHIELKLEIDERIPSELVGDSTRVRQVAMNLIGNAIKFTEEGFVAIAAERMPDGAEGICQVRIQVADTGIGIPPEKFDRLFQPFSQVDSSTTRRYGGTGLGLVICSRLMGMMGGTIGATSTPGKGSTFEVVLPVRVSDAPQVPAEPANRHRVPEPGVAAPLRVLVAEDNDVNQIVCRRLLEKLGHSADVVADGSLAVSQLQKEHYDLVLMDVHMPGTDGLEATRQIRRLAPPCSSVPIVALTASAMSEDQQACFQAGTDGYLTKPVSLEALRRALERWQPRPK